MGISNTTHRYRFIQDYASSVGAWAAGEIADLDEDTAAWINRDVGMEVVEHIGEPTAPEVSDGQSRLAAIQAQADKDARETGETINRSNFKAVGDKE